MIFFFLLCPFKVSELKVPVHVYWVTQCRTHTYEEDSAKLFDHCMFRRK